MKTNNVADSLPLSSIIVLPLFVASHNATCAVQTAQV